MAHRSQTRAQLHYLQLGHGLIGSLQLLALLLELGPEAPALFGGSLERTRRDIKARSLLYNS